MEGVAVRILLSLLLALCVGTSFARAQSNEARTLVLVIGAPGEPAFEPQFSEWAGLWEKAAEKGGLHVRAVGIEKEPATNDLTQLLTVLSEETTNGTGELWLVFIGHGTFDDGGAKFNLRGPDISATNLAAALKSCRRPLAIIQCASASGPFLTALSAPGRVVVTSTRSGYEVNFSRFGGYMARAIGDPKADLDHDGQVSLLEAFLTASRQVEQFYREQGRLMTEHALIDDNGDGLGTPPEWFRGVLAVKKADKGKSVDGVRANQMILVRGKEEQSLPPAARARRDELEQQLSALRSKKNSMTEDAYYSQVEKIMAETARLYEQR